MSMMDEAFPQHISQVSPLDGDAIPNKPFLPEAPRARQSEPTAPSARAVDAGFRCPDCGVMLDQHPPVVQTHLIKHLNTRKEETGQLRAKLELAMAVDNGAVFVMGEHEFRITVEVITPGFAKRLKRIYVNHRVLNMNRVRNNLGWVMAEPERWFGEASVAYFADCGDCGATGERSRIRCSACDGLGEIPVDMGHRIQACIDTGQPFWTVIIHNVRPDAIRAIDKGRPRTFRTDLGLDGHPNAGILSQAVTRLNGWERAKVRGYRGTDPYLAPAVTQISVQEQFELLDRYPELQDATTFALDLFGKNVGGAYLSPALAAYMVVAVGRDEGKADQIREFFRLVRDPGVPPGGSEDRPPARLKERLAVERLRAKQLRGNWSIDMQLGFVVPAWVQHRNGDRKCRLKQIYAAMTAAELLEDPGAPGLQGLLPDAEKAPEGDLD